MNIQLLHTYFSIFPLWIINILRPFTISSIHIISVFYNNDLYSTLFEIPDLSYHTFYILCFEKTILICQIICSNIYRLFVKPLKVKIHGMKQELSIQCPVVSRNSFEIF